MDIESLFGNDDDITPRDKLLYIIDRNTKLGILDGRKKLTKLVFFTEFLDLNLDSLTLDKRLGDFDFIIYKYGPFSHDLMDSFDDLKNQGYIQERQTNYTYDINLTDDAQAKLEEVKSELDEEELEQIDNIAEHFSEMDGGTLEDLSLEYLGIPKEEKQNYIGMPIEVVLSEGQEN